MIQTNPNVRMVFLGTGSAVPERVLGNDDLSRMVATSDEWIRERTGIRNRHIVDLGNVERTVAASDLAAAAGKKACEAAGIDPAEIDGVLCATISADMPLPSCAVYVQRKVGAKPGCMAFDLAAACGGFLYGMALAQGLLMTGRCKKILLVGVEVLSGYVNWQERTTCVLFGDGAGAAVLSLAEGQGGVHSVCLHADGTQAESLMIPGGGSRSPASEKTLREGKHFIHMDGKAIFVHAVRNLSSASLEALQESGWSPEQVDLVVPHQANLRILEGVAQRLRLPMERFYVNIDRYGNTSSASVPIALDEVCRKGLVKAGDRLLFCALGAGLAWGAACVEWGS